MLGTESERVADSPVAKPSYLEYRWYRQWYDDPLSLKNSIISAFGTRGSGKSAFLENLGEHQLSMGRTVLDTYGIGDECLGWLRSDWVRVEGLPVLLLKGEGVDVRGSFEVKPAKSFQISDLERYRIILVPQSFFRSDGEVFEALADMLRRIKRERESWTSVVYCIMREASEPLFSRNMYDDAQSEIKATGMDFLKKIRHFGFCFGLDTQDLGLMESKVRSQSDYVVFKSLGIFGLPRSLWYLYRTFEPRVLQRSPKNGFAIISRGGGRGEGFYACPPWHKREGENLKAILGFKVDRPEILNEGVNRGKYSTLGDVQHAEVIKLYSEGLSIREIASDMKLNSTSTPWYHIQRHNKSIEDHGVCFTCNKVDSPLKASIARKKKRGEEDART